MSFICHIHNYTEYNQQWNVFSEFNPSKCTHTWSSGQPRLRRPGSSWGFGALLKGLTSVVDNSSQSQASNPQPRITSPTLYPLGHDCPRQVRYKSGSLTIRPRLPLVVNPIQWTLDERVIAEPALPDCPPLLPDKTHFTMDSSHQVNPASLLTKIQETGCFLHTFCQSHQTSWHQI